MITKKVKLCGKSVTVGMCWGTIIAFANYTGKNLEQVDFQHPTPSDITYLILAAMTAYYQSVDKEAPVRDTDLLYKAKPQEIVDATIACCNLIGEFYAVPKTDETADEAGGDGKN